MWITVLFGNFKKRKVALNSKISIKKETTAMYMYTDFLIYSALKRLEETS